MLPTAPLSPSLAAAIINEQELCPLWLAQLLLGVKVCQSLTRVMTERAGTVRLSEAYVPTYFRSLRDDVS